MNKDQKGFSPVLLIILVVSIAVIATTAVVVIRKKDSTKTQSSQVVLPLETPETAPNGKPENAVNAINEQLLSEISIDEQSVIDESDSIELDTDILSSFQGVADEKNL